MHLGHLTWKLSSFGSSSVQLIFRWCYIPMMSSSIEDVFHLGCLPLRSSFIEVVFIQVVLHILMLRHSIVDHHTHCLEIEIKTKLNPDGARAELGNNNIFTFLLQSILSFLLIYIINLWNNPSKLSAMILNNGGQLFRYNNIKY